MAQLEQLERLERLEQLERLGHSLRGNQPGAGAAKVFPHGLVLVLRNSTVCFWLAPRLTGWVSGQGWSGVFTSQTPRTALDPLSLTPHPCGPPPLPILLCV